MPLAAAWTRRRDASWCARPAATSIPPIPAPSAPIRAATPGIIVVVEDVADLWALERAGALNARYHVLGGALSPLDGVGPDDLGIDRLVGARAEGEVARGDPGPQRHGRGPDHRALHHRPAGRPRRQGPRLAHGVPVGGELDYLDEGTLVGRHKQPRAVLGAGSSIGPAVLDEIYLYWFGDLNARRAA